MTEKNELEIAIVGATLIMVVLTLFIVYFVVIYRKKQRSFEQEREIFKVALLKAEVEIKEQTLTDVSRDLHDNLGQIASLVKINLNLISNDLSESDRQKIVESQELLKQLTRDIKSLSTSLKGENLSRFGLARMIEMDIERYRSLGGLKINYSFKGEIPQFKSGVEIFLYRMAQEILNNAIKHSKADLIDVLLEAENHMFLFCVKDNGRGFEYDSYSTGSGLQNLKDRCKIIGAQLDIQTALNSGTTISIRLTY